MGYLGEPRRTPQKILAHSIRMELRVCEYVSWGGGGIWLPRTSSTKWVAGPGALRKGGAGGRRAGAASQPHGPQAAVSPYLATPTSQTHRPPP